MNMIDISTTELRATTQNGFPWHSVDSATTSLVDGGAREFTLDDEDTDVSFPVWVDEYVQRRIRDSTKLRADLESEARNMWMYIDHGKPPQGGFDEDIINRIALLSRKYAAKKLSAEETARLEVLTERLGNLMPAITDHDLARMEDIKSTLERISSGNVLISEKYGLDGGQHGTLSLPKLKT